MVLTRHTFVPDLRVVTHLNPVAPMETIIAEPMLWSASIEFARERGGPLTQRLLETLAPELPELDDGWFVNIDTESQDLFEGQYPSIPGWHCDGDGGPAGRVESDAVVYACFLSTHAEGVSRTVYADEAVTLEVDPEHIWPSVHRGAERFLMRRRHAADGEVLRFDGNTLHRAGECHRKGWRWWFRLTIYRKPPRNVIKNRVQVYSPIEARG